MRSVLIVFDYSFPAIREILYPGLDAKDSTRILRRVLKMVPDSSVGRANDC